MVRCNQRRTRGRELAQRIAITRSHFLGTPRFVDLPCFVDLPWPPGYDMNELAAKQLREFRQPLQRPPSRMAAKQLREFRHPCNARLLEQLVPMVVEGAIEAWDRDGDIKPVREGKLSLGALKARVQQLDRDKRRYPSPF